ncbi:MAG: hypothetical protein HXS52_02790 [Theionarchaea archaeon]|nr:hypothetical protein [Theionarchaea archaeon]
MEEDIGKNVYYWVTPLFRDVISNSFDKEVRRKCHHAPTEFYQRLLSSSEDYEPIFASELIGHATQCGMQDLAVEKEGNCCVS